MKHPLQKLTLLVLLPLTFIDWITVGIVFPIFPSLIFQETAPFFAPGTSDTLRGIWLGALLTAAPLAQFLTAPILGSISDQKGRKQILITTTFITFIGYVIAAWAIWIKSLSLLFIGRAVEGIGVGNASVINAAVADVSTPGEKAKNFGLIAAAKGFGFTLGPGIGALLAEWGGFDKPFIAAGIITLICLIIVIVFMQETQTIKKTHLKTKLAWLNLKQIVHIKRIKFLFLAATIFYLGFSFYWDFIPVTWIKRYSLSVMEIGIFFAYATGFYGLSAALLIRPVVKRFLPIPILFFSLLTLSFLIFPLLLPLNINWYWAILPLQEFLNALIFPTILTFVSNSVEETSQGEALGLLQSFESFTVAIGPLIAGLIIGKYYNTPIVLGGSCMLIAAMILFFAYRKRLVKAR